MRIVHLFIVKGNQRDTVLLIRIVFRSAKFELKIYYFLALVSFCKETESFLATIILGKDLLGKTSVKSHPLWLKFQRESLFWLEVPIFLGLIFVINIPKFRLYRLFHTTAFEWKCDCKEQRLICIHFLAFWL